MDEETLNEYTQALERMTAEEINEYLKAIEEQERNYENGTY